MLYILHYSKSTNTYWLSWLYTVYLVNTVLCFQWNVSKRNILWQLECNTLLVKSQAIIIYSCRQIKIFKLLHLLWFTGIRVWRAINFPLFKLCSVRWLISKLLQYCYLFTSRPVLLATGKVMATALFRLFNPYEAIVSKINYNRMEL